MPKRQRNMQKRKETNFVEIEVLSEPQSKQKKINRYYCRECYGFITTIQEGDAINGTTPMMLSCRVTDRCEGTMISSMYRVDQNLEPTHEWYKPAKLPKDPAMRQHIEMGGLMLRTVGNHDEA